MTGAIELGGTKTVVAVGSGDGTITAQHRFPTTTPDETIATAIKWLEGHGPLTALGVGAFGPVGVNMSHESYGRLLETPKPGWSGFDLVGSLGSSLEGVPVTLDTDVNAAALAEYRLGAARGVPNMAYITIGTGIGAGFLANGQLIRGALHPEFGHLKVPRHPDDSFPGCCPYHGDCLEGLASGTALRERWQKEARDLPADDEAWNIEAWYLAHGVLAFLAISCPSRVVIGGGVSQAEGFHARVEELLRKLAAGYFASLEENTPYIVPPALGQDAGITGALLSAALPKEPS